MTSWLWSFGDGGTSTLQNPAHVYSAPGVYDVTLTITGSNGVQSTSRQDYVVAGYRPEDTNQDGVVNHATDVANLIAGWNRNTSALSTQQKLLAGDNNLDGLVDLDDAYRLLNALKGTPPQFVALSGDFDGNARVDGNDFLAWQRRGGSQSELNAWKQNFATDNSLATAQMILAPPEASMASSATAYSAAAVEEAFAEEPAGPASSLAYATSDDESLMWLAGVPPLGEHVAAADRATARVRDRLEFNQEHRPHAHRFSDLAAMLPGAETPRGQHPLPLSRVREGGRLQLKDRVFDVGLDDMNSWRRFGGSLAAGDGE